MRYYPVLRAFKVPSPFRDFVAQLLDNFIIWTDVAEVAVCSVAGRILSYPVQMN